MDIYQVYIFIECTVVFHGGIKQQRKRPSKTTPCTKDVEEYDKYYRTQISQKLGCVPPYWKNTYSDYDHYHVCKNSTKLQEAHRIISDPKTILGFDKLPCNEMTLLSIDSVNNEPSPKPNDVSFRFIHSDKIYEEIKYSPKMGFENWLSNVGGFSGIFLGYSMMQVPNLLIFFMNLYHQKKYKLIKSKCIFK